MLKCFVYLLFVYIVDGLTCPPACDPVRKSDCNVYIKHAACSQDVKDISLSEAHCGCLWQTYIQTVEPAARVIFSREGKQCYLWASKSCAILENSARFILNKKNTQKRPKTTVFRNSHELKEILRHILKLESIQNVGRRGKGIAKKRRRNGVGTLSEELGNLINKERQEIRNAKKDPIKETRTGTHVTSNSKNKRHADPEFIGKPGKSGTVAWVEVIPEKGTKAPVRFLPTLSPPMMNTPNTVKDIYTIRQHWIDLDMPVDQFKLGVFMIILLLNTIVVIVLIFCRRSDGTKKEFEAKKQAGDLNTDIYFPDSPDDKSGQGRSRKIIKSPLSAFLDSCRKKMKRTKTKANVSTQYLQMMEVKPEEFAQNGNAYSKVRKNSPYIDVEMYHSSKHISRGLYDDIDEESDGLLDNTYEEPLPSLSNKTDFREFHKRKYSLRTDSVSEDDSPPSKYYPRESEARNKSVSFSLSPNTYLTLQDRVDASAPVESKETS